jgi:acetyl-CoA/propionyl-CoA carboxylase, biotin carboxylase, biotin carboxyl carrier protein
MFESILIANRGEIAVRVIRAAREMGIRTIAVFSDADEGALWTRLADEAHRLGPAPARESYLDIARVTEVALKSGASAVHPGYGLLSESAEFAQAVLDAGAAFIGPRPHTIALMGDKVEARRAAIACGVPVLAGSEQAITSTEQAFQLADGIGWPLAVKASFGGGGRGMRVAADIDALAAALEQAGREAAAAFGRADVFLERYLVRPRHIEVQVLGDGQGGIVHLGNRDCSIQRRHQKLVEEAPAPSLPERLRDRITDAAITLCRSVGYQSAGTVEFLVDIAHDAFYFLEMNTRLQVEHGVTELVTGIDLVQQQILIASGAPLGFTQDEVRIVGHAIQARIAAEDPWEAFRPVPGRINRLSLPLGPWLRLDFGVQSGDTVQRHYDSMFGKIQSWGHTREEARRRLGVALDELVVEGIPTTAPYLRGLLEQRPFVEAKHDTGSLERDWLPNPADKPEPSVVLQSDTILPGVSERRVSIPWGGRLMDVAVFGVVTAAGTAGVVAAGRLERTQRSTTGAAGSSSGPLVIAPMDAVVIALAVKAGQAIIKGAPLLVLEAMKMEVVVSAPHNGIVDAVFVTPGETVKTGAKLALVIAPPAAST